MPNSNKSFLNLLFDFITRFEKLHFPIQSFFGIKQRMLTVYHIWIFSAFSSCLGQLPRHPPRLNMIKGVGCGGQTEIKVRRSLPRNPNDWPCTIITDNEEFRKYLRTLLCKIIYTVVSQLMFVFCTIINSDNLIEFYAFEFFTTFLYFITMTFIYEKVWKNVTSTSRDNYTDLNKFKANILWFQYGDWMDQELHALELVEEGHREF